MKKLFTTLDILNITSWYKQTRENEKKPLSILPLKIQWIIKKNITAMATIADNFTQLRDEADQTLRDEFISDEKSYEDVDDKGQPIRKIKDEYLTLFQQKSMNINQKLSEILAEKNEIEIICIDIDNLVNELEDTGNLTIEDLDILNFMTE